MSIRDLSKYIVEEYLIREIDRADMPQIGGDDVPEVLETFKKYGIPYRHRTVRTDDLQPVQSNVVRSKIDSIVKRLSKGFELNPIFISSDWYIIDGHHRWLANKEVGNETMRVIEFGYPKKPALKLFNRLDGKLNEGVSGIKNTVVVYPGRFQPFHKGHYYSYNDLVSKFGRNNVFIGTSNVSGQDKTPFNFSEKKNIITKLFGIPGTKVVQLKNPYKPDEILKRFDPETTAVIVALGEKDAGRLGGKYYVPYKGKADESYLDRGYVYIVPQLKLQINGRTITGTEVRKNFSKELFKGLYPRQDDRIFNFMSKKLTECLIMEGGAYGHLQHPFDDVDMTFGDMKTMIQTALEGKLDLVQEKTDGQNLMFSYINGKVKAARNASHIKNFGKGALDISGISNMFAGRGEIQVAFTEALNDLSSAISKLSKSQRNKIFKNGKKFMSVEVIYPQTTNVIPYDYSMLIFHGTFEYDKDGNIIASDKSAASLLARMIKKVNANMQNTFEIRAPNDLKLPKVRNFSAQKAKFTNRLNTLQRKFNLKDSDKITLYHQAWWENFINTQAKKQKYAITNKILYLLIRRWAFDDRSESITKLKKQIEHDRFTAWVDNFDKTKKEAQLKANIKPFESIFLELGSQILQNINVFLSSNPDKSLNQMKSSLEQAISDIESSDDVRSIGKLKAQLKKLNSMGGMKAIIPSEGITYMFNNKLYKLTGTFAPINQILGIIKFGN